MPNITITGVDHCVDGTYLLDLADSFNGHELHLIKQYAGVRTAEIGEAMTAGDYDLIICLTKIALDRNGKDVPIDVLLGAKIGGITFEQTDEEKAEAEEEDALPPVSAPKGADETESEKTTSGDSSSNGSDTLPVSVLPVTGVRH